MREVLKRFRQRNQLLFRDYASNNFNLQANRWYKLYFRDFFSKNIINFNSLWLVANVWPVTTSKVIPIFEYDAPALLWVQAC